MWHSRHSEVSLFPRTAWTNRWIVHFSQVSPCLHWCFHSQTRQLWSVSWVSESNGCSLFTGLLVLTIGFWVFGWVCSESSPPQQISEPKFFHPIILKRNFWRRSRKCIYFLVNSFSRFHHDSLRETISWECVVKDDCVRSSLIEFQSFLVSKFDVDPIHRVLMFLPYFLLVPKVHSTLITSGSWCSFFIGSTIVKNTVCLFLKFSPPVINPEFVMECKLIAHPIWWM